MTVLVRAALYLRVSTGRQADNDLSIPDQRRQAKGYCTSGGWEIVADYVETGVSATDDWRPEFQRMIDAATTRPPGFDVIVVHSFSRFFRDQFQQRPGRSGICLRLRSQRQAGSSGALSPRHRDGGDFHELRRHFRTGVRAKRSAGENLRLRAETP